MHIFYRIWNRDFQQNGGCGPTVPPAPVQAGKILWVKFVQNSTSVTISSRRQFRTVTANIPLTSVRPLLQSKVFCTRQANVPIISRFDILVDLTISCEMNVGMILLSLADWPLASQWGIHLKYVYLVCWWTVFSVLLFIPCVSILSW